MKEERVSSEQVFDGRLLKVFSDEVRLPNGDTSVREWVDHLGASAVVPLFEDGTTILLRQYRYAPGREFIVIEPAFPLYAPLIRLNGGTVKTITTRAENGHQVAGLDRCVPECVEAG